MFSIETKKLTQYYLATHLLLGAILLVSLGFPAIALIILGLSDSYFLFIGLTCTFFTFTPIIFYLTLAKKISLKQVNALNYWLDSSTLRINQGIYKKQHKAIPLSHITNITLIQGPLMRQLGIWAIYIQTAGSPQPEAILQGLKNPEGMRDFLLDKINNSQQQIIS